MKTALFLFCFLGATAAFGQAGGGAMSAEPQVIELPSHPRRATQQGLGFTENLRGESEFISARGERPLWEVAPKKAPEIPLGDVARRLREQHETARKSDTIWEN